MSPPLPHASVVVPALDRPASLARCLGALRQQVHLEPLELVVVDAASGHAPSAVAEVVDAVPGARLVRCELRFQFASEDRDWSARVAMLGYDLAYAPDAVVVHDPEVSTATFLRKHAAYGRGVYQFGEKHGTDSWAERPSFYVGLLREGFAKGLRTGAAVGLAQAATGVGFAAAGLTDLRVRRAAAVR